MRYRCTMILLLLSGITFAASNNDLYSTSGDNCAETERSILENTFIQSIYQQMFDCLNGNTYSLHSHGIINFFTMSNKAPTLEKDGNRYQLQYFSSVESMNHGIEIMSYKNQLSAYNDCSSSNSSLNESYSVAKTQYSVNYLNYQAQLKKYNASNASYQNKFNVAKKIKNQLVKYAYDICMDGGLVNSYGVPVPKIGCNAYAQIYVMIDLVPEYNYRHNNMLNILSTSPENPPIAPDKPQAPVLQDCGTLPIMEHNS